jgi:hypothetical protein
LTKAEGYVERLIGLAGEITLEPYRMVGGGFEVDLLMRRGKTSGIAPWLRGIATFDQLDLALAQPNETIASIESKGSLFNAPELLRVHGVILMKAGDE